jgi:hypothetical protein
LSNGKSRRRGIDGCKQKFDADTGEVHCGAIFGTVMLAALHGRAAVPRVTGIVYDAIGSCAFAFKSPSWRAFFSIAAIWRAAAGKVRTAAGRAESGSLSPSLFSGDLARCRVLSAGHACYLELPLGSGCRSPSSRPLC